MPRRWARACLRPSACRRRADAWRGHIMLRSDRFQIAHDAESVCAPYRQRGHKCVCANGKLRKNLSAANLVRLQLGELGANSAALDTQKRQFVFQRGHSLRLLILAKHCRSPNRRIKEMIRPAVANDASCLAAVAVEVWLNTYIRNGVSASFADYALNQFTTARFEEMLSQSDNAIWVSENSVGIDGFIRISLDAEPPLNGCSDLEISTLYVQPRHQGSGTGHGLLATGLQFCASTGRPNVWLSVNAENTRATRFYLRNGFTKIGDTQFQIEDETYPNHILRHKLT